MPPPRLLPTPPGGKPRATRIVPRGPAEAIQVIGRRGTLYQDLYYRALRLSWPRFLAAGAALFLLVNLLFGALYALQPAGISDMPPGSFLDAFFFSVQTWATIGYGRWAPVSAYANTIVTAETLAGASTLAVFAGIAFARFARPTAKIAFSRTMVVTRYDGVPTLMVRLANERGNQILEAQVSLFLVRDEQSQEGHYIRRLHDLHLVRSRSPMFGLSFLVMHRLDETSPLHGCTAAAMQQTDVEIVAIVSGLDETTMQTVHARTSYDASSILFGHRFADLFGFLPDGTRAMDYRRFHETEAES